MKPILVLTFLFTLNFSLYAQRLKPVDEGSKVHFVIKNFGINTGGDLQKLDGEIIFNPDLISQSFFNVTVKSSTVDTDNSSRDESLREDYFESAKYPDIRLVSTKVEKTNKTNEGIYFFTGKLIMKDITKDISFPFKAEKINDDWLFTGDFSINRLDFNVGKSSSILGNKVQVTLKVLAKKL